MLGSQQQSKSRSCRHRRSTQFLAVTPGRRNRDLGTKKPVREPFSIRGPATKDEITGQTRYCATGVHSQPEKLALAAESILLWTRGTKSARYTASVWDAGSVPRLEWPTACTRAPTDSLRLQCFSVLAVSRSAT